MHASRIVVVFEQLQLSFQVVCSPKEQTIQILPAEGPDEPFDKWMGPGNLGHRLHCFHPQDAQVGLPAVEPEVLIVAWSCSMLTTSTGSITFSPSSCVYL